MSHSVELVIVGHMGEGMRQMLDRIGLAVVVGAAGDARLVVSRGATDPR